VKRNDEQLDSERNFISEKLLKIYILYSYLIKNSERDKNKKLKEKHNKTIYPG